MAYTPIDKSDDYFNTVLYTGNGTTQSITGVGFQPDLVWLKDRDFTYDHQLHDSNRGASAGYLASNNTNVENPTYPLTSFDSDGWTTVSGGTPGQNASGDKFVAWNWLASNTTASNTDGSITSNVSANTTSGFSIVSYTGTGSSTTVGHGLGVAPSMLIFKNRDSTDSWNVQHDGLTSYDYYVRLNTNSAQNNDIDVGNSAPTSTVVSVGSHPQQNGNGNDMILYAFADKKGFSKFGSYTGNGSTDGPFIYTGFRPAFVMTKRIDGAGDWAMMDNKRPNEFNVVQNYLKAQVTDVEQTDDSFNIDILSNGWKARYNNSNYNGSGGSYIYMAFAENPFVTSTGIPACAR